MRLLFKVTTITGGLHSLRCLFKGVYYLTCDFYSREIRYLKFIIYMEGVAGSNYIHTSVYTDGVS